MQVLKFGGTSVANAENMSKVVDIVTAAVEKDRTILVCSAISKCTDTLIRIGSKAAAKDQSYLEDISALHARHEEIISSFLPAEKQDSTRRECDEIFASIRDIAQGVSLLGELSRFSLDALQGRGELLSTKIIAARFACTGIACKWVDSRELFKTHVEADSNVVDTEATYSNIRMMVVENPYTSLFILPGFIASDATGRMTTLGRGGSDYTASLLAVGSRARLLEIWTDVTGIMTSNPKDVPTARTIPHISYRAALELSHFGAKVIYPPTIQPVVSEGIPIYVKNTFEPDAAGTLIEENPPRSGSGVIGISNSDNIALLSLEGSGMVGIPGFSSRLFDTLSRENINIILITQASSVHTMCIAVAQKDAERAKAAADATFAYEISLGKLNPLKVEQGFSIVCLVGDDFLGQKGTTGRMLDALGRHSIPVRATAQGSSERNISVIVPSAKVNEAIRYIHNEFFDKSAEKTINLFIAGYGTVGRALLEQIEHNGDNIAARSGKRMRVIGLSNSRRFLIDTAGLELKDIRTRLEQQGESTESDAYFKALANLSIEDSVFVDCTASGDVAYKYINLMRCGYNIVACNKIAFSAPGEYYRKLKDTAVEMGVSLRYETTVGAALPVLETITRCVCSGDEIHKVEAVLSGTLNYIFTNYRGGDFASVVRDAQEKGYTEPDPRLDLSGRDVLRKLIILSREAGLPMEEEDIHLTPLLGPEFFEGSIDDFYARLENSPLDTITSLYAKAQAAGEKLRFVASLTKDGSCEKGYRAEIGLVSVDSENPLFHLKENDNAAIITTDFYPSPLVIQGAGAGRRQTASGILNDILL